LLQFPHGHPGRGFKKAPLNQDSWTFCEEPLRTMSRRTLSLSRLLWAFQCPIVLLDPCPDILKLTPVLDSF
jgi:hypothetical protein